MRQLFPFTADFKKLVFIAIGIFCLAPQVSSPMALVMGLCLAQLNILPFEQYSHLAIKYLLQISVIGLGFGMHLGEAAKAGKEGLLLTICSIFITLLLGLSLGRRMKIKRNTTLLIAVGTAICGGSAIAAISPLVHAKKDEMSVSLGTVFLLNAVALFVFPWIGHYCHLSQNQFGLWSAIAIHDTSSVVGASSRYGLTAMHIATTVKLERALWIIPLSVLIVVFFKKGNAYGNESKAGVLAAQSTGSAGESPRPPQIKVPYFICLFVLAMLANTFLPFVQPAGKVIVPVSEKMLTLTLFFIGAGLSRSTLKTVGLRPLIFGVLLWCFIATLSLWVITGFIH